MSFMGLYRGSFYAMLAFATLVLSVDSTDNRFAIFYPVAVMVAGVVALVTVDRNAKLAISDAWMNFLALGSLGLTLIEYFLDPNLLLLSLGHWLVYLQLILMFRRKTVMEDWELFLLGVVQVMVGSVISQNDSVGYMLFIWAVLSLWVLGLFSLRRDSIRATFGPHPSALALPGPGQDRNDLYPGLLNIPFLLSASRVTLTTLALGGAIFLVMPRRATMASSKGGEPVGQHLTGFDDEVKLGQLGEILENDSVVMSVELFNETGTRIVPDGEPLWRGVTMAIYEKARWFRQARKPVTFPIIPPQAFARRDPSRPRGLVRQQIKLEPNDSNVLFGFRPMLDASAPRRIAPDLNGIDGTISRPEARNGPYDYEVWSLNDDEIPQPGESGPSPYRMDLLKRIPDAIRDQLTAIAKEQIARRVAPEKRDDPRAKARALEYYLRDSGQFGYTLKLDVVDPSIDPVLDFLVNRKEGHCEYFASALTLLLRSVDVPARLVNGFKGGDWNDLARIMNVRQKHAHSWVEAYLGDNGPPDRAPLWLTLDPTPGAARDQSVASVGGFGGNFRQITDLVRYVWVFYVVGFNADRQNRVIYGPLWGLVKDARRGFAMMWQELQKTRARLTKLVHFEDVGAFISVRGFFVSFVGLLMLVGLVRGVAWLFGHFLRIIRGPDPQADALAAGAAHYRRLATLLHSYGLERPPAETQSEFARRAGVYLSALGSDAVAVADVPERVVEAFYLVRFGHEELPPGTLEDLETRLDHLEASLKPQPA